MTVPEPQPSLPLTAEQAGQLVAAWLGAGATCSEVQRLPGGMVNSVFRLVVDRPPHTAVVKLHEPGSDDLAAEAAALRHLRRVSDLPVPAVLHHDGTARHVPYAVLVLEDLPGVCLDGLDLPPDDRHAVDRQLGELLAGLHQHTAPSMGGVGGGAASTPWPEEVARRLRAVCAQPTIPERLTPSVLTAVDEAIALAPDVLARGEPSTPTLVHGDVWDGNVLVEEREGRWEITGLLDPSAEYADPEVELAYLEVFGRPRPALRSAYDERHPPRPGHEQRRVVYWLHTALLHVALFEDEVFRTYTASYAASLCELG